MNYVVDDVKKVVDLIIAGGYTYDDSANNNGLPLFIPGHELEINNRLQMMLNNPATRDFRFPVVCLFFDIEERMIGGVRNLSLNMLLANKTNASLNTEERYQDTNSFKKVLYPLFESFMDALSDSGLFMWPGVADRPEHSKIDRPFWGTPVIKDGGATQANKANIFTDYIDAIQIRGLKINQKIKYC